MLVTWGSNFCQYMAIGRNESLSAFAEYTSNLCGILGAQSLQFHVLPCAVSLLL